MGNLFKHNYIYVYINVYIYTNICIYIYIYMMTNLKAKRKETAPHVGEMEAQCTQSKRSDEDVHGRE